MLTMIYIGLVRKKLYYVFISRHLVGTNEKIMFSSEKKEKGGGGRAGITVCIKSNFYATGFIPDCLPE